MHIFCLIKILILEYFGNLLIILNIIPTCSALIHFVSPSTDFHDTKNPYNTHMIEKPVIISKNPSTAFMRLNRCYSCMSPLYEQFFKEDGHLSKFFYEPRNFTHKCDDPMDINEILLVPCRAICLTLTQELIIMGRKTGKKMTMRGCATSLSRYGFHNRTFAVFDQYDMCREVFANELFRFDTDSQPIEVCSCLGDKCNRGVASSLKPTLIIYLALVIIFFPFTSLRYQPRRLYV